MEIKVHRWPVRVEWKIGHITVNLSAYSEFEVDAMIDSLKKVTLTDLDELRRQLEELRKNV